VTVVAVDDGQTQPAQTASIHISGDAHFDNCFHGSNNTAAAVDDGTCSTESQYTVVVQSQQ